MAQESKNNSTGIVIATIGVVGAIIAAIITTTGNYKVEKMRQEVELTKIALSVESTEAILQNTTGTSTETIHPSFTATTAATQSVNSDSVIYYDKLTFAILVGVTNQTSFNLAAASNYSYVTNTENVDAAILELSKVYSTEDVIYVVHVPELRATPGNPGSCKLSLKDVEKLKQYPLGWIIGGNNIIPSQYESSLQFCFSQ